MLGKWGEIQSFIKKYNPDKDVVTHGKNLFNDNAVFYFRQVLKRRQKQTSLDRFLVRQSPVNLKQVLVEQRDKREKEPQKNSYLTFLRRGTPLPNNNIPPFLLSIFSHQ